MTCPRRRARRSYRNAVAGNANTAVTTSRCGISWWGRTFTKNYGVTGASFRPRMLRSKREAYSSIPRQSKTNRGDANGNRTFSVDSIGIRNRSVGDFVRFSYSRMIGAHARIINVFDAATNNRPVVAWRRERERVGG